MPKQIQTPEHLNTLTINQVCNILHVSRTTLWKWECNKILVPLRIGRRVLYSEKELNALINKS